MKLIVFLLICLLSSCFANFAITEDISLEDFKVSYIKTIEAREADEKLSFIDIDFFDLYGNSKDFITARRCKDGSFEVEIFISIYYLKEFPSNRNQYTASIRHNYRFEETLATAKFEISDRSKGLLLHADQESKFSTFITIGSKEGGEKMTDIYHVDKKMYSKLSLKKLLAIIEFIANYELDINNVKKLSVFPGMDK